MRSAAKNKRKCDDLQQQQTYCNDMDLSMRSTKAQLNRVLWSQGLICAYVSERKRKAKGD